VGGWKTGFSNKGSEVPVNSITRRSDRSRILKLLDHEQHASDQVPLLLSMKEDRLALVKAVDSGDTDLGQWYFSARVTSLTGRPVYHVLLHLHKRLPLGNFFRLLEDGGERLALATRLLQVYAREQNREMLRDFYYSDDRRVEIATLLLEEAATMSDQNAKITAIKAAQKSFSEDKDRGFEAKVKIVIPRGFQD
jgi:hypothetical protein